MRFVNGPICTNAKIERQKITPIAPAKNIDNFLFLLNAYAKRMKNTPTRNDSKPCLAPDNKIAIMLRKIFKTETTIITLLNLKKIRDAKEIAANMAREAAAKLGLPKVVIILLYVIIDF